MDTNKIAFVSYLLISLNLTAAWAAEIEREDKRASQPKYPMLAPARDLLPCEEKSYTIFCTEENTKILNVPHSLLADPRISVSFAELFEEYQVLIETLTEIPQVNIDDATLRSIIYFMTIIQGLLSLDSSSNQTTSYNHSKTSKLPRKLF